MGALQAIDKENNRNAAPLIDADANIKAMEQMGLSSDLIAERMKLMHAPKDTDSVTTIIECIAQEFDFLLLHCIDLNTSEGFNWQALKVKMEMLDIKLNNHFLVLVIEAFNLWVATQNARRTSK